MTAFCGSVTVSIQFFHPLGFRIGLAPPFQGAPHDLFCVTEAHGAAEEEEKDKVDDPNGPRWVRILQSLRIIGPSNGGV